MSDYWCTNADGCNARGRHWRRFHWIHDNRRVDYDVLGYKSLTNSLAERDIPDPTEAVFSPIGTPGIDHFESLACVRIPNNNHRMPTAARTNGPIENLITCETAEGIVDDHSDENWKARGDLCFNFHFVLNIDTTPVRNRILPCGLLGSGIRQ